MLNELLALDDVLWSVCLCVSELHRVASEKEKLIEESYRQTETLRRGIFIIWTAMRKHFPDGLISRWDESELSASPLSELECLKEGLQRREEEERKVSVVEELKEEIQRLQERRGRQQEDEERSREFEAVKREVERLQRLKEERETNLKGNTQVCLTAGWGLWWSMICEPDAGTTSSTAVQLTAANQERQFYN